jgi:hypothetical protein
MEGQPAVGAEAPHLNLLQRVMLAFTAPSKLGEFLRTRQPWFWTLAIVGIVSVILFMLVPTDVFREAIEQQMRDRAQGQDFDAETAVQMGRIFGTLGALLGTFIGAFVIAGVVYLAMNVMMGGDSTYKQHLSAVSHMYWINLLGFILLVPLWIAKEDMSVRLGLGLLLAEAPSSFVGHFMNAINLFGLWAAAALGAMESGLSGGKMTVGKGIGTVIVLYVIWAVVSAVWATVMGGAM